MKQVVKHINKPFIERAIIGKKEKVLKPVANKAMENVPADETDQKADTTNKNKKTKKDTSMMTENQISALENAAESLGHKKVLKKDRGLIERTESSKIILAEDNRQVLID